MNNSASHWSKHATSPSSLRNVSPVEVHDVRLEGTYPDSKLVVQLSFRGSVATLEWALWGADFGEVGEWGRAHPEQVADEVMIQVYEFDAC